MIRELHWGLVARLILIVYFQVSMYWPNGEAVWMKYFEDFSLYFSFGVYYVFLSYCIIIILYIKYAKFLYWFNFVYCWFIFDTSNYMQSSMILGTYNLGVTWKLLGSVLNSFFY